MRYAVIKNGFVENVIEWDGTEIIKGLEGADFICSETADIGDAYADGMFIRQEEAE